MVRAILPPVGFILLALLGLLLAGLGWRKARWLTGLGLCASLICAVPAAPEAVLRRLEAGMAFRPAQHGDPLAPQAIVVLGGTMHDNAADAALLSTLEPAGLTMERLRAAAILHKRSGLPLLLSGGDPATNRAMAAMLANELGAPPRWVEDASPTTWENAFYSAQILRGAGIGTVYVVTDGWHMRRALLAFRRAGLAALPAPSTMTAAFALRQEDLMPALKGLRDTYYAAHEIVGNVYYALRR
jgi:uncharacterized SAM-binding protein YcdF (DUF218 family)